jgi:hypothetical protein
MPHPLVLQLRFTRREFLRAVKGVSDEDGQRRFPPLNCLSWNLGHLAWQEQRYFLAFGRGALLLPEIDRLYAYGAPACAPPLSEIVTAWKAITAEADPWLERLTTADLLANAVSQGKPLARRYGDLIQRTIYHYWYHLGENMAIRQLLGHSRLPTFVGNIDRQAPYQPEAGALEHPAQPPAP